MIPYFRIHSFAYLLNIYSCCEGFIGDACWLGKGKCDWRFMISNLKIKFIITAYRSILDLNRMPCLRILVGRLCFGISFDKRLFFFWRKFHELFVALHIFILSINYVNSIVIIILFRNFIFIFIGFILRRLSKAFWFIFLLFIISSCISNSSFYKLSFAFLFFLIIINWFLFLLTFFLVLIQFYFLLLKLIYIFTLFFFFFSFFLLLWFWYLFLLFFSFIFRLLFRLLLLLSFILFL